MKKYFFISFLLVIVFIINGAYADTILVRAAAEKYRGKNVGSVYINDQVVIRVYDRGTYQSPYKRAKEIVRRITDLANKGKQLNSIKVMKGTTATVGIADNREIFRIYEDDVLENDSTPLSLATAWIANVQNAIKNLPVDNSMPFKEKRKQVVATPKKAPVTKPKKVVKPVSKKPVQTPIKEISKPVPKEDKKNQTLSPIKTVSKAVQKKQPITIAKKPQTLVQNSPKAKLQLDKRDLMVKDIETKSSDRYLFSDPLYNSLLIGIVTGIFLILVFLGFILYIQLRKVKMSKEGIVSHASSDELENLVSHLIGELETRSADITTDFQQKISHLENLMMTVDTKANEIEEIIKNPIPAKASIPEPSIVEPVPAAAPIAPHIESQPRTKQEIIYEMADQGTSVTDIAKKLGIGTGEVQLILDLKQ